MSESVEQRKPDQNVDDPDVLLDIPKVSVDSLRLAVDGLDADLSLRARLANLLQIDAGVRVHLHGVELDVDGVQAEAQLRVRLEQLVTLLGRALDTIDNNPQIIESLSRPTGAVIDDVNRGAEQVSAEAAEITASAQHSDVRDELRRQSGAPGEFTRPARPKPPAPSTGAGAPGGGAKAGRDQGGGGQGGSGQGDSDTRDGGASGGAQAAAQNAAQFAEQAGETLRQAGRSVWEAIQGGLAQHRPQDGRD
ncbi:hypothetical protein [Micromonospora sp. NPDC047527]|uniref:hypothetical protein n=1 Tax=Micromonospora sp. NPDC047527 TaxID=3155144 RepID=UPI0033D3348B